ncbi:sporulation protein YjcZ [Neobacillus mesonae]|nr:sporulation protein YjcZ [Neobacillus mesonae]
MSGKDERSYGGDYGNNYGGGHSNKIGAVLVLFILLVIIVKSFSYSY